MESDTYDMMDHERYQYVGNNYVELKIQVLPNVMEYASSKADTINDAQSLQECLNETISDFFETLQIPIKKPFVSVQ